MPRPWYVQLESMSEIYREQIEGGVSSFTHIRSPPDHGAEKCISDPLEIPGVPRVCGDQCQYGQEVQYGEFRGQPVRKSTGYMSNAPRALQRLTRRCACRDGTCSRATGGKNVQA